MIIAVDFDGTIVEHAYPKIGFPIPGAISTCLDLQKNGHKLILLTMRAEDELRKAVTYCEDQGLRFWAVNDNPEQVSWTPSRKVYAHLYIDDAAVGCPLIYEEGQRPRVDWGEVVKHLHDRGALTREQVWSEPL